MPNQYRCDQNAELAKSINVDGTRNVTEAANAANAQIILVSTTAVLAPEIYGLYGKTKLDAEEIVKSSSKGYLILRPGLIIGQSPNVENDRFQNRLLNNITKNAPAIYDNVEKYEVTWAGHVSEVIAQSIKKNINGQTIPILAGEYKTRFEIARDILQNFGVAVTPKDERESTEGIYETTAKLQELGLKVYRYPEIVEKTTSEIKEYLKNSQQQ
jgi:dTDP-4-dehydrorhamnose reductase